MPKASPSPPLGPDFAKLWTAAAVSNIGDGVTLAAAPLLLLTLTRDPALVAGAAFVQHLPWLLFSLVSGAYVDRLDRRRLASAVEVARAGVMGLLALAIALDMATVPLVYAALFLLGTGDTLAGTAATAMLPGLVPVEGLGRANSRVAATEIVGVQLAGPPLGAWLFTVFAAAPFTLDAVSFLSAALLIAMVAHRPLAPRPAEPGRLRAEIAAGLRWLWQNDVIRLLAVCLCLMNIIFMVAFAIWPLYVRERLGVGSVGFGLMLTAFAAGGLVGSASVNRLERRFGASVLLRAGLVIETATHLSLAMTTRPWVAAVTMVVFGVHATVWGVIAATLRQRLVPDPLLGRVGSAYRLLTIGGAAVGALLAGPVARHLGLAAPFAIAFGSMAVLTVVVWRKLTPASLAGEVSTAATR